MKFEGIILINKKHMYTSFYIIKLFKTILNINYLGYVGTLDPFATGLLIILIGKPYTELSNFFSQDNKYYEAVIKFGVGTDTDDYTGNVIQHQSCSSLNIDNIKQAIKSLIHITWQIPSKFSAINVNGIRSYNLIRNGKSVKLQKRKIIIYDFKILKWNSPFLLCRIHCSKGTYIRSIARDIGYIVNIPAHLISLRRIMSGSFVLQQSISQKNLYL